MSPPHNFDIIVTFIDNSPLLKVRANTTAVHEGLYVIEHAGERKHTMLPIRSIRAIVEHRVD